MVRSLVCVIDNDGKLNWREDPRLLHRYHGFALMGLAHWRTSKFGTSVYDDQIVSLLNWYAAKISSTDLLMLPSYGVGTTLYALRHLQPLFPMEYLAKAIITRITAGCAFNHYEDALLIMGLSAHWDDLSPSQKDTLRQAVDMFLNRQTRQGLFVFPNHRKSFRHQNQMYISWGLAEYGLREQTERIRSSLHRTLAFTVERRMRSDGGILWHEGGNLRHRLVNLCRSGLLRGIIDIEKLYECHQTFFVNAVDYLGRLGDVSFSREADRALQWIWGCNSLGRSLVDLTDLGVPWRAITLRGRWKIPQDMFKGIYEIGSYLRALSAPERSPKSETAITSPLSSEREYGDGR